MLLDAVLTDEADLKHFVRVDHIVNDLQQAKNSPYAFTVDAQFDRTRGSGKRNEARACNLVFVKR